MLAFLTAIQSEADALRKQLSEEKITTAGGVFFYEGTAFGYPAVIAKGGVGKVNAAHAATLLIERYAPEGIVNSGVAGGLGVMKPLDTVVATALCQHDMDTSPLGEPKGFLDGVNEVFLKTDETLTDLIIGCLPNAARGVIASGDQFICDTGRANEIKKEFGAIACEMEGAAMAQVAAMHGVPFAAFRVISDGGDNGAEITFQTVVHKASEASGEIMRTLMQKKSEEGNNDF